MRSDDERQEATLIYTTAETLHCPREEHLILAHAEPSVPLSIFSTKLSALQALVRYLHEARSLSFSEIGVLLGRSQKTIWTTYQAARKASFPYREDGLTIPLARFSRRQLAPLETLVTYLAELGLSNVESARLLSLDPRTTWTAKQRAKKKQEVVA